MAKGSRRTSALHSTNDAQESAGTMLRLWAAITSIHPNVGLLLAVLLSVSFMQWLNPAHSGSIGPLEFGLVAMCLCVVFSLGSKYLDLRSEERNWEKTYQTGLKEVEKSAAKRTPATKV